MRLTRALAAGVIALALGLSGCTSEEPAAGGDGFNEEDVVFATDMIQHHAQALSMVDLTMGRELSPELAELAEEIRQAQAPEIEQMVDWLEEWDQPVPATGRDHANAHGDEHGGTEETDSAMPGMMSTEQMTALEDASDAEFEDLWLSMMIEHHEGAVEMAKDVLETTQDAEVKALAEAVVKGQEAEISTMRGLLTQ